jgi:hypothetical protein
MAPDKPGLEGLANTAETSMRITVVPADVRTENLPNKPAVLLIFTTFSEKGLRVYFSAKANIHDIFKINKRLSYFVKNMRHAALPDRALAWSALRGTDLSQYLRSRDLVVSVYTLLYRVKLMTLRC